MINVIDQVIEHDYAIYNADCVEVAKALPDNSIDFSCFSPPFESLYVYSNSDRDLGNSKDSEQFWQHYKFLIAETFRVIAPGRLVAIHCMNLPTSKAHDGYIGIRDFRGEIIRAYQDVGFIYHSEVCIWKDPVVAMQRTKALGLLHKQIKKDSAMSRQGIADYVVVMRKPGENEKPITGEFKYYVGEYPGSGFSEIQRNDGSLMYHPTGSATSIDIWQRYASPVWMDINQTDTLQFRTARESDDERHICVAKGSLVLTKTDGFKPIEEILIGDLVLTHKGRWRPVLAKKKTSQNASVLSITAAGVSGLNVTPRHQFWCRDASSVTSNFKTKAKTVDPGWVEAKDLDLCYLNMPLPDVESVDITEKESWIIGRWLADGHMHFGTDGRTSIHISAGHEKIESLLEELGNYAGTIHQPTKSCNQVRIKDRDRRLRDFLSTCGKVAHDKQIPQFAYYLDAEKSKAMLDGYMSGDGHFNEERARWATSSVSKKLLLGIQFLILRAHGVPATLHPGRPERQETIEGRTVNCKQEWILTYQSHGYSFSFVDELGAWKKVKSALPNGSTEVWDLQVEDDESFFVEGCVVHNCPLQLQVIERCLQLWSNPGDVVWSPFTGIGSEGYVSLKLGRNFIGSELKTSYFNLASRNLKDARKTQYDMFAA